MIHHKTIEGIYQTKKQKIANQKGISKYLATKIDEFKDKSTLVIYSNFKKKKMTLK